MTGVTQVSAHTFEIGGSGAAITEPQPEQTVAIRAPLTPPHPAPLTKLEPVTLKTMVAQARARLRQVKAEIRVRKNLERERSQLERLIKAATNETDNVRRLRAAG